VKGGGFCPIWRPVVLPFVWRIEKLRKDLVSGLGRP